jgi:hypothetical protein
MKVNVQPGQNSLVIVSAIDEELRIIEEASKTGAVVVIEVVGSIEPAEPCYGCPATAPLPDATV